MFDPTEDIRREMVHAINNEVESMDDTAERTIKKFIKFCAESGGFIIG